MSMTLKRAIEGLKIALEEHDRECNYQASIEGENAEVWDELDVSSEAIRIVLKTIEDFSNPPAPETGWIWTPQTGGIGHCDMAQIFDADGNALAFVEVTDNAKLASDRARLIAAAPKLKDALAAMLDLWSGYECPEVDAAIAVMQEIGEDRWSMQAQMDAAKAEGK